MRSLLRHSDASAVRVHVGLVDRSVRVRVTDNGTVVPGGDSTGHGLVGISERVKLYGGEMSTGNVAGGGFAIRTRLPLGNERP